MKKTKRNEKPKKEVRDKNLQVGMFLNTSKSKKKQYIRFKINKGFYSVYTKKWGNMRIHLTRKELPRLHKLITQVIAEGWCDFK